jgi:glycosyltransferase involved in cell wall biosynthesis
VVVSSSGSFTAHIAAARLARHYGIPWIAEYGDPWFLNPLGSRWPWVRAMNGWWERGVLRSCSGMTVTTEETAALYRDWLGEEAPPAAVVPCGFYRLGDDSAISPLKRGLRIAYVGSASAGSRDLGLFMRILEDALLRQEPGARGATLFRVIGSSSPLFEQAARAYVTFKTEFSGWVTYTDSIREMGNADALLLIGNRSASQIPGKVYQYLASGRPVIYLSQMARGDPTERLLEAFGGVLRLKTGAPENAAQLAAFLSELELHGIAARKRANDPRFVASYSWAALGLSFAAFVEARAA